MSTPALTHPAAHAPAATGAVCAHGTDPRHLHLRIRTARDTEIVDLTDRIDAFVMLAGIRHGLVSVHTLHTTTAVVVNEQEPLLHDDFFRQLDRLVPRDARYDHDDPNRRVVNRTDTERTNGHAHCRALMLGSAVTLPIVNGRVLLGRWQRVLFVELDGPQERTAFASILAGSQ